MSAPAEMMEGEAPAPAPAAKKSKLPLIIAAVVVLAAGGGGGAYFMLGKKSSGETPAAAAEGHEAEGHGGEHGAEGAKPGSSNYLEMSPPFVVNLDDVEASRYLQVDMQARAADSHSLDQVKDQMPRIRNAVLLLLSQQKYHEINTREGKEKLQGEVLAEVQKIMTEETGKPVVTAIYFTSFVMQ